MTGKTHWLGALQLPIAFNLFLESVGVPALSSVPFIFYPLAALFGLVADSDHPEGTFTIQHPIVARAVHFISGQDDHRGNTHTVEIGILLAGASAIALSALTLFTWDSMTTLLVGLTLLTGYLAHLKEDSACITGVKGSLFQKGREMRFGIGMNVSTGQRAEDYYFFVLSLITVATIIAALPGLWYRISVADPIWYQSVTPLWYGLGIWLLNKLRHDIRGALGGYFFKAFLIVIVTIILGNGVIASLKDEIAQFVPTTFRVLLNTGVGSAVGMVVFAAGLRYVRKRYTLKNVKGYVIFSLIISWCLATALGFDTFMSSGAGWVHSFINWATAAAGNLPTK